MFVLAITGSLRAGASNTALLEAARRLAPPTMKVKVYRGIDSLPHFNPDLDLPDDSKLPSIVAELRQLVGRADALLLSTPEYAHGLPGAFKNVLDWLVGSREFPGKRVAIISPSSRSTHAQAQLREILTTMSARIIERSSVVIQLPSRDTTAEAIVADQQLAASLRSALDAIREAVIETPNEAYGDSSDVQPCQSGDSVSGTGTRD